MSGNLFDAAYTGMMLAVQSVNERKNQICPCCNKGIVSDSGSGICQECEMDIFYDQYPQEDDAVCSCCKSQAAEPGESGLCNLCEEIKFTNAILSNLIRRCIFLSKF